MAHVNSIFSGHLDNTWCVPARTYSGGASCNITIYNSRPTCIGKECPALVITNEDHKTGEWIGYCGAIFGFIGDDHGNP